MTARQEITALCLALVAAAVAMLGMVGLEAHEANRFQRMYVDEHARLLRVQDRCAADSEGGGRCSAGTFAPAATTTTTVTP